MPSSCSHVAANGIMSYFVAEWCSVLCRHHIFFTHSSVDGPFGFFHVLSIVNSAAVSIGVSVSLWICRLLNASGLSAPFQPVILVNGTVLAPSPLTPSRHQLLAVGLQSFCSLPCQAPTTLHEVGVSFQSLWGHSPVPARPRLICPSPHCEPSDPPTQTWPLFSCCVHSGVCSALYDLGFAHFCSLPICKVTSDLPVVTPNGEFSVLNLLDL